MNTSIFVTFISFMTNNDTYKSIIFSKYLTAFGKNPDSVTKSVYLTNPDPMQNPDPTKQAFKKYV